jgi:hypothetical protein
LVYSTSELKLIEVIYTCDGKEYLTPQQLIREIKDEVYLAGGRARSNKSFSHNIK